MKAQDIEPGEYLAGTNGTGRYTSRAKCRVIGPGKPADRPGGSRMHRSGAKFWQVEWLAPYRTTDRLYDDAQTVIPSAWIIGPWTAEHEAVFEQESGLAAANEALLRALVEAFDLQTPTKDERLHDVSRPVVTMSGRLTEEPRFTLTKAAVQRMLDEANRLRGGVDR